MLTLRDFKDGIIKYQELYSRYPNVALVGINNYESISYDSKKIMYPTGKISESLLFLFGVLIVIDPDDDDRFTLTYNHAITEQNFKDFLC